MTYYHLNDEQRAYLQGVVRGKVVADLGCGDGSLAVSMVEMGAAVVHAVDKAPARISRPGVVFHQAYFDRWRVPEGVQVAVVSWPHNSGLPGIPKLLRGIPDVVYLGKNTDGTTCGSRAMFSVLLHRNPVRYVPDSRNVMIHYGNESRPNPLLHHEEVAAITHASIYRYDPCADRKTTDEWRNP